MEIREALSEMAGGPQFRAFLMTGFATVGRLDFGVADQAIGHLRQVRGGYLSRFGHAAVTSATGISVVAAQMPADFPRWLQIPLVVDRGRDDS